MPRTLGPGAPKHSPDTASHLSRRRFITRLGVLAGITALAPLLRPRRSEGGSTERLEAGRAALGTWMRVVVRHPRRAVAERAIAAAFAAVNTVDDQMSIHRGDSQLARVNRLAGREAAPVDDAVIRVVSLARDAARGTGGVFDPTVLPLMHLYGFYGPPRSTPPTTAEIDATLAHMGWDAIRLDTSARTLGLARPGAGLDLGSIGKGWAVDRAIDAMRALGVRSALVDLGGKMYGMGTPDDDASGWSVGLFNPLSRKLDHVFVLRDAAVGTSGNTERWSVIGRTRIGHLFDAKRGLPSNGHLSASVVARNCVEADLLCTVAYLVGPDRFRGWPGALQTHFIG